jgi:hypothetical protein
VGPKAGTDKLLAALSIVVLVALPVPSEKPTNCVPPLSIVVLVAVPVPTS